MAVCESEHIDASDDTVHARLSYMIKESRHDTEKPYEITYDAPDNFPLTNMSSRPEAVSIRNFRPLNTPLSFNQYGFSLNTIDCDLTAVNFDDDANIRREYYPAIEKLLHQSFPDAAHIRILEHGVRFQPPLTRKRDSDEKAASKER
jgi:hypothetical protein